MEWYWWVIIGVSVLVVAVILFMLLAGGEEEAAEENAAAMHDTLDLNDAKVLKALAEDGLVAVVGETQFMQVGDHGKKGFSWILNEDCEDVLTVEILEGPPLKEEKAAEEEEPAEEEEAEEKDEKKLRDGDGEEMDQIYMSATGAKAGNCTFAMAYAEAWDGNVTAIEEDDHLITFNVTVSEAPEKEEAAAEEAEE